MHLCFSRKKKKKKLWHLSRLISLPTYLHPLNSSVLLLDFYESRCLRHLQPVTYLLVGAATSQRNPIVLINDHVILENHPKPHDTDCLHQTVPYLKQETLMITNKGVILKIIRVLVLSYKTCFYLICSSHIYIVLVPKKNLITYIFLF